MSELMVKGAIKKDERGKFVMADGSMIIRERGEPLSSAVYKRLNTTTSNLITLPTNHSYSNLDSDFSDSPIQSFPVIRTPKTIKANTKYKFEGVFPPPVHSKHHAAKSSITKSHVPPPPPPPSPPLPHPSHPIPTEVSKPQFDPLQDDAIMEDATTPKVRKFSRTAKDDNSPKSTPKKASAPMKSAISQQVQPTAIIDKILNTPINITVGEVLGSSREISSHLQNYMKFKRATTGEKENVVAFSLPHTRTSLIHLAMECSGRPLKAIIDTGSMCNVVFYKVYQACINLPIDKGQELIMKDANRGHGKLMGLVSNVPLICGGVKTYANLYVAENSSFQILLGCPWQRGNHISINERPDGTWVIFNDQPTLMEVLASPGEMPLEVQLITTEEPPLPQPVTETITSNALHLFNMPPLPHQQNVGSSL
ncbi:hypothetical protein NLI96_g3696 [Meripilus lineatus]|uniref:DUF4100 domain-containing protein n=1 Tax=Meripilus lineatus TaxID=2056292 RepID=A0AAD5YIR6_9APHY|nr:hypothetical protein NLI96_g3696 [Physisporinus lineatus]